MKLHFVRKGSGPTLLLLHGLFGSSNNWAPLVKALENSFDLIAPDLRNHGRSPHDAEAGLDAMAGDLTELIDALNLQRVFLLGHSLGGRVAMRLALDDPARISRLLVADMAPCEYPPLFPEVFEALNALNLASLQSRADADEILKEKLPDASLRAFLLTNLSRNENGSFAWKMNLAALDASRAFLRSEIKAPAPYAGPALFLRGEKSDYLREGDLKSIQALFPAAGLKTLAGAGHWLHVDKPAEFSSEILRFFS